MPRPRPSRRQAHTRSVLIRWAPGREIFLVTFIHNDPHRFHEPQEIAAAELDGEAIVAWVRQPA